MSSVFWLGSLGQCVWGITRNDGNLEKEIWPSYQKCLRVYQGYVLNFIMLKPLIILSSLSFKHHLCVDDSEIFLSSPELFLVFQTCVSSSLSTSPHGYQIGISNFIHMGTAELIMTLFSNKPVLFSAFLVSTDGNPCCSVQKFQSDPLIFSLIPHSVCQQIPLAPPSKSNHFSSPSLLLSSLSYHHLSHGILQ